MEHIEIPPFYVGQEVIAIRDHSILDFKKGQEFRVLSIKKSFCKCNDWEIDIGIRKDYNLIICTCCGKIDKNDNFYKADSFSPNLEFKDFISMKEVTEKASELISGN